MIMRVDAAMYGVLLLDFIIVFQLIVNPRKPRISHLIETCNQNQSYGIQRTYRRVFPGLIKTTVY